jgi:hypothetical protein
MLNSLDCCANGEFSSASKLVLVLITPKQMITNATTAVSQNRLLVDAVSTYPTAITDNPSDDLITIPVNPITRPRFAWRDPNNPCTRPIKSPSLSDGNTGTPSAKVRPVVAQIGRPRRNNQLAEIR